MAANALAVGSVAIAGIALDAAIIIQRAFRSCKIPCDSCSIRVLPSYLMKWGCGEEENSRCADCYWEWDAKIKRERRERREYWAK